MRAFAKVLYGSQNYGLDGPDSDRDYKILLCPDFDDFYNSRKVSKDDLPYGLDPEHNSVMSIIQFNDLLLKGNPNCIEMLFSVDWQIHNKKLEAYLTKARQLYGFGYLAMVWQDFYKAVHGIALNAIKRDGINAKTVSRARYFCGLMVHTSKREFVMNETSWRGNFIFQVNAQAIRFCEKDISILENTADAVQKLFKDMAFRFTDEAKLFCMKNPSTVRKMSLLVSDLHSEMKQMVYESIHEGYMPSLRTDNADNLKMMILGSIPSVSGGLLGLADAVGYIRNYSDMERLKNTLRDYSGKLEGIYKAIICMGGDQAGER